MDFIDWFTVGLIVAASVGFVVGICCCCLLETSCIDAIIPSGVTALPRKVMGKRRRAAALAGMVFDTCTAGEEGAGGGGCAICLNEYAGGERRATISDCNHRFHALCIEKWIDHNCTCPLCRHNLV